MCFILNLRLSAFTVKSGEINVYLNYGGEGPIRSQCTSTFSTDTKRIFLIPVLLLTNSFYLFVVSMWRNGPGLFHIISNVWWSDGKPFHFKLSFKTWSQAQFILGLGSLLLTYLKTQQVNKLSIGFSHVRLFFGGGVCFLVALFWVFCFLLVQNSS